MLLHFVQSVWTSTVDTVLETLDSCSFFGESVIFFLEFALRCFPLSLFSKSFTNPVRSSMSKLESPVLPSNFAFSLAGIVKKCVLQAALRKNAFVLGVECNFLQIQFPVRTLRAGLRMWACVTGGRCACCWTPVCRCSLAGSGDTPPPTQHRSEPVWRLVDLGLSGLV